MLTVIFDMDGTLINSANAISSAVNEIRKNLNLQALDERFILDTINTPGKDWAKILYNIDDFEHSTFKQGFERYFIKHYEQSVILYDGVIDILTYLQNKDAYIAIATNAPQDSLDKILSKHKISEYFNVIVGVSAKMEPKPSPQMLNFIQNQSPFDKALFVGDSKKDEEAAKNANIPYLSAKWNMPTSKANEFSNANELLKLFEKYFNDSKIW